MEAADLLGLGLDGPGRAVDLERVLRGVEEDVVEEADGVEEVGAGGA